MAANWKYDERQRQIEKEQIREKIIEEEITRRRILEEEVRRELRLEKKIAFRPLEPYPTSFGCCCRISPFLSHDQSRIPCKFDHFYESRTGSPLASPTGRAIGFQELPFQCHTDLVSAAGPSMASNGIQPQPSKGMTMLARLETNVPGQKRKSPIPEADQEWNNINSTKKPKGWNCMLCNVGTTSEIDLNLHMQGRKHKAKKAGLITQERRYDATAVAKECNLSNEKPITVPVGTSDLGVNKACKASGESLESVHPEAAEAGKHNDVDLCSNGDTPIKAMPSVKSSEKSKLWCDLCQVGTTCPEDMSAHEVGKKHLAKLHKAASSASPTKPLSMELPKETKETEKEVMQVEQESNVIPSVVKETVKNIVDGMSRGNENRVLCPLSATSESCLDEHKQGRKDKAKEAELIIQKTVIPNPEEPVVTLGVKKVIKDDQGGYVSATRKGDAPGPQKKPSAKLCEKFKLWYRMSQVGTSSAEGLHDNKLYDEPCALPDVSWFIEEVAQEVIDEDVLPRGRKETGKDAMQDE